MVYIKQFITTLSSALAVLASPTLLHVDTPHAVQEVSPRQATEIPVNQLYMIEWYPNGCGNGELVSLYGCETSLGDCVKFNGRYDKNAPDKSSVHFFRPEDTRTYKWRIFGTNDCTEQIAEGEGGGCFNVPSDQKIGAVIVYT